MAGENLLTSVLKCSVFVGEAEGVLNGMGCAYKKPGERQGPQGQVCMYVCMY